MNDRDVLFRTILRTNRVILNDEDGERVVWITLLSRNAERDLYEQLIKDNVIEGSFSEFHTLIGISPRIRKTARQIIKETIISFPKRSHFNFDNPNPDLLVDDIYGETDLIQGYILFTPDEADGCVDWHFFNAEFDYYMRQLYSGKNYSWNDFLTELQENLAMWNTLLLAFRESILKMDFKPAWRKHHDSNVFGTF